MNADFNSRFVQVPVRSEENDLKELAKIFSCFNLQLDSRDPFYEQSRDTVREEDVIEWMNVEAHKEVREAMVEDELEHHLESTDSTVPETVAMRSESEKAVSSIALLSPMSDTSSQFHVIKNIAFNRNVVAAADYLQRA